MHDLYANFVKILNVCKKFSANLVNKLGNMPRPGVVPKFCDLEVITLNLTAISKVSAFTVKQYLNTINNRSVGRTKYALA